jgi:hypothetical protein
MVFVAIDRRILLGGGLLAPAAAVEFARHDLLGSIVADRAAADADEWQEIAWDYRLSYDGTPPAELLHGLQIDLAALGEALRRQHADLAKRELNKVAALLASFTAQTVGNLGDLRSARRWWRTACLGGHKAA